MGCVRNGINPNTVGDPNPATCINDGVPGPGPDQIVGTPDDATPSTIGQNLLSFIPLRFALPLAMTSIVIAPLLSGIINKSFPQPLYWVGLALVMGGVSLVLAK